MADLAHCLQTNPRHRRGEGLYRFKVFLAYTAKRANPIVRDLFKRRARVDPAVRIPYFRIINVVAYGTSVLSHFLS